MKSLPGFGFREKYYPSYGLKIAAISSKKLGDVPEGNLQNNYQYQGTFSETDADIGWNDFELRNYDAQIGRFVQQDPFAQYASPYIGMGNDPVNVIDPSGGIGIPCPGTSQLAIFFMKAGEVIGNGLNVTSHLSSFIGMGVHLAQVGTQVYNNSVVFRIVNRQLTGNITLQAGAIVQGTNPLGLGDGEGLDSGPGDPLPPIFWEEYWYPSVEAADYDYSNKPYPNLFSQVMSLPEYPNVKFLVFHFEQNKLRQDINGDEASDANEDVINPNSTINDKHEVPYKSTKEGGAKALMYPVNRGENRGHGASLSDFYKKFNLKDGDIFLVPLYKPTLKPSPVRNFKPSYKPVNPVPFLLPAVSGEAIEVWESVLEGILLF